MGISIQGQIKRIAEAFDSVSYSDLAKATSDILRDIHEHCTWAYFRLEEDFDPRAYNMHQTIHYKFIIYFTTRYNEQSIAFQETMAVSVENLPVLHRLVTERWAQIKANQSEQLGYALSFIARNGYSG
jgi:hypothetical protein